MQASDKGVGSMTVYFHLYKNQEREYVIQLLYKLCKHHGIQRTYDADAADAVFVSMNDITLIKHLREASKFGKPVVCGGFASIFPVTKIYADYVVQGEAYNFMYQFARIKKVADIIEIQNVATHTKPAVVDEYIDYALNPIVKVSPRGYYLYCGKGCNIKCSYCQLSHSRTAAQSCEIGVVYDAVNLVHNHSNGKGRLFTMMSHSPWDFGNSITKYLARMNITIPTYNSSDINWRGEEIKCGMEFATEEFRAKFAKPISTSDIATFVQKSKNNNNTVTMYMIAGLETQTQHNQLMDSFGLDDNISPRIHLKYSYIDPQPYTPFADFDVRKKIPLDVKEVFAYVNKKNKRVRTVPIKYIAHSTWRTIMQRAKTHEQANFAYDLRNEKDNEKILRRCEAEHPILLGNKSVNDLLKISRHNYNSGLRFENIRLY